jgi:hypothetical protein
LVHRISFSNFIEHCWIVESRNKRQDNQQQDLLDYFWYYFGRVFRSTAVECQTTIFTWLEEHGRQCSQEKESRSLKGRGRAAAVAVVGGAWRVDCRRCASSLEGTATGCSSAAIGDSDTTSHAFEACVDAGWHDSGGTGAGGTSDVATDGVGRSDQDDGEEGNLKKFHGWAIDVTW